MVERRHIEGSVGESNALFLDLGVGIHRRLLHNYLLYYACLFYMLFSIQWSSLQSVVLLPAVLVTQSKNSRGKIPEHNL